MAVYFYFIWLWSA